MMQRRVNHRATAIADKTHHKHFTDAIRTEHLSAKVNNYTPATSPHSLYVNKVPD